MRVTNDRRALRRAWCMMAALCLPPPRSASASGLGDELRAAIATRADAIQDRLIAWRRDFHAHPELGNQEHRTAEIVAAHLRRLGLRVRTGVARTGVVAVLEGGAAGKVVALRADMDALPVKEALELPFASKARAKYLGVEVDVMHACGHDGHVAILMAVAEILAGVRHKLPGTVVFYFQPAEEGPSGDRLAAQRPVLRVGFIRLVRPLVERALRAQGKRRGDRVFDVTLLERTSEQQAAALSRREIDIAIAYAIPELAARRDIEASLVTEQPYALAIPAHAFVNGKVAFGFATAASQALEGYCAD